jgi:hypothetical protein
MSDTSPNQADLLLAQANRATTFASQHGQACISIPIGKKAHQVVPVRSPRFRDWLIESFFREHGVVPRHSAVRDALRLLEAHAHCGA